MSLAQAQTAFMAQILDEDAPAPANWDARRAAGMAIYRNNYRSALVEALCATYERTVRWVGEDVFRRAAAHHLIANPPTSWTLDHAGAGFDATCAELFANDPEVAELAWLEWSMLEAFTARDAGSLDGAAFAAATAEFGDEDWSNLKLTFLPGSEARMVGHDMRAIWRALGEDELVRPDFNLAAPQGCLVWREGERPTFLMIETDEVDAFQAMQRGACYSEICDRLAEEQGLECAVMRAGAMLGRWLNEGLVVALSA